MEFKLTVGKIIWFISMVLFILFSYNQSIFDRVVDIFTTSSSEIIVVQEFSISTDSIKTEEIINESIDEHNDLFLEVEKIKWKFERLEDEVYKLEAEVEQNHENKSQLFDNLIALVTVLIPLFVPILTTKYNKKEINLRKQS